MKQRCKICGRIGAYTTYFDKNGWYHSWCIFRAWQDALKEIERLNGELAEAKITLGIILGE